MILKGRAQMLALAFSLIITGLTALPPDAEAETFYNVDRKAIAIKGYDAVAYFTVSKPVKGKKDIKATWQGATWLFTRVENRDTFLKNPEKYAPRYGGYCAYGVAEGGLFNIAPDAWTVYEGSLYLNQSKRVRELWLQDVPGHIRKADVLWPKIRKKK
jgi:hypothetical protein